MDDFHHPCKDTCSGWRQGFQAGCKEREKLLAVIRAAKEVNEYCYHPQIDDALKALEESE